MPSEGLSAATVHYRFSIFRIACENTLSVKRSYTFYVHRFSSVVSPSIDSTFFLLMMLSSNLSSKLNSTFFQRGALGRCVWYADRVPFFIENLVLSHFDLVLFALKFVMVVEFDFEHPSTKADRAHFKWHWEIYILVITRNFLVITRIISRNNEKTSRNNEKKVVITRNISRNYEKKSRNYEKQKS